VRFLGTLEAEAASAIATAAAARGSTIEGDVGFETEAVTTTTLAAAASVFRSSNKKARAASEPPSERSHSNQNVD